MVTHVILLDLPLFPINQLVISDNTVHTRPAQRTQIANMDDSVTLVVRNIDSPNSSYRWKHNGVAMPSWDGQLSVSIPTVTAANAGVYTCFAEGQENQRLHGIMRLIVRGKLTYSPKYVSLQTSLEASHLCLTKSFVIYTFALSAGPRAGLRWDVYQPKPMFKILTSFI